MSLSGLRSRLRTCTNSGLDKTHLSSLFWHAMCWSNRHCFAAYKDIFEWFQIAPAHMYQLRFGQHLSFMSVRLLCDCWNDRCSVKLTHTILSYEPTCHYGKVDSSSNTGCVAGRVQIRLWTTLIFLSAIGPICRTTCNFQLGCNSYSGLQLPSQLLQLLAACPLVCVPHSAMFSMNSTVQDSLLHVIHFFAKLGVYPIMQATLQFILR